MSTCVGMKLESPAPLHVQEFLDSAQLLCESIEAYILPLPTGLPPESRCFADASRRTRYLTRNLMYVAMQSWAPHVFTCFKEEESANM